MGTLCAAIAPVWAQMGCDTPAQGGGPSWKEVRQSLEQRVLEAPANAQGKLALAQYLTYCDSTRREGIVQLSQLATHAAVGASALESWKQALAWVESDVSSAPLFRAYLRLRPQDRQVRAQLETLESGGLLAGNRSGTPAPAVQAVAIVPTPTPVQAPTQIPTQIPTYPVNSLQKQPLALMQQAPAATNFDILSAVPATLPSPSTRSTSATPSAWDVASSATAVTPATASASQSLQGQIQAIRADIQDIEQQRSPEFSVGTLVRTRKGEDGMNRLVDTEVPIELAFPVGEGKMALRVTPTLLHAGAPASSYDVLSRFGAGPVWALSLDSEGVPGAQNDAGLGLGLAYEDSRWLIDIGTTPLGFSRSGLNAGVRLRQPLGEETVLDVGLSHRPVRDSVLSFAGMHDARTGVTWGGVSAAGGRLGLTWDNGLLGIYGYGAGYRLTGKEVADNTKIELGAGTYYHFVRQPDQKLTAGLALTALKYQKNLSYFTYGHGGYFSPQRFYSLAFPVEWQHRYGRLNYALKAAVGVQYLREDSAPYFPTLPWLQSGTAGILPLLPPALQGTVIYKGQQKTGMGYSFSGVWEYQVQPKLWLGGMLGLDNARDYRQFTGGVYLRYALRGTGLPRNMPLKPVRSPYDHD